MLKAVRVRTALQSAVREMLARLPCFCAKRFGVRARTRAAFPRRPIAPDPSTACGRGGAAFPARAWRSRGRYRVALAAAATFTGNAAAGTAVIAILLYPQIVVEGVDSERLLSRWPGLKV